MPRHRLFAILSASIAVLVLGAGFAAKLLRQKAKDPSLAAVPAESYLVVTIDLDSVRHSAISPALVQLTAGVFSSAVQISTECGFDPTTRAHSLALAVPESGSGGEFGLIITGEIQKNELVACAEKVIATRGGKVETKTDGSFTVLTDSVATTKPGESPPHLALREGGPLLVGRGDWLETMMRTAEGARPDITANKAHAAIRSKLEDPAQARTVVASAVLPKELRVRLKREMGADVEAGDAAGNSVMAAVLGVDSAGLAFRAGAAGEQTSAVVQLHCETSSGCIEVAHLIEKKKTLLTSDLKLRLIGLGPALDSLDVSLEKDQLSVRAHAPSDALAKGLERAISYLTARNTTPGGPAASNQASSPSLLGSHATTAPAPTSSATPFAIRPPK